MNNIKTKIIFLFTFLYFFSSTVAPALANTTYSYDANGNMTSDGVNCYTYNDANQLSQVKNCSNNQIIAQYVYDYQGNRIVKKNYVNGTLNNTVYSPDKGYETKKLSDNSTQNTTYYYVNDELVAKKNPDGSKNYYHSDNLHSTSVLTDQSGNVVENSSYYPFGDIRSGGTKSKYLYTGQENDPETGLDYYNARYYNSHLRHFTQADTEIPDPYTPQDLNRYSYVRNNPMTYTDPSGHEIPLAALSLYGGFLSSTFAIDSVALTNPNPTFNDYRNAAAEGFATGFLATGGSLFFAPPVIAGLKTLGMTGAVRSLVASGITGGGVTLGVNTLTNVIHNQSPAKNSIQQTLIGAGLSIASDGIATRVIPAGVGRPATSQSLSLNLTNLGKNSIGQAKQNIISNFIGGTIGLASSVISWFKLPMSNNRK